MAELDPLEVQLGGMQLIEASAGTGKTHAIGTLYLRVLLELDLDVTGLLVVTFTNAATAELKGRIRLRLRQTLAYLDRTSAECDEDVRRLVERRGRPGEDRRKLADALTLMDEASVFTIHGFCQRMLRELAFETGSPFDLALTGDDRELRAGIVRDFWRLQLDKASPSFASWLTACWQDPDALAKTLKAIPVTREVRLQPAVDAGELAAREDALLGQFHRVRAIWQGDAGEIGELLRTTENLNRRSYPAASVETATCAMSLFLAADEPRGELPEKQVLFTVDKLKSSTRKGRTMPEHRFFAAWSEFRAAHEDLPALRRAWFLRAAVDYLGERLREHKETARTISYDDLLSRLRDALRGRGGETLATVLRNRYPVALIDEFQDTDDLQYEIFERIYRDRPDCVLFLIGDPKQAIYGFRGADVFTYFKAARSTSPGGRHELGTNWRSASHLVTAVNTVFERADSPFLFEKEIPFLPVNAAGSADLEPLFVKGDAGAPFRLWWLPRDAGRDDRKPITKGSAEEAMAAATAREVVRLLAHADTGDARIGGRSLVAADIAVLVRSVREAELVRGVLDDAGVASVFLTRKSVFATEEADELQRVLLACAEPGEERAIRAALCTRIVGFSVSGIAAVERDERLWDGVVGRFIAYQALWQRGNILAALRRIIEDYQVVSRYVALGDGERRLTNLLQLAELLEVESRQRSGADRLLQWFAERRGAVADDDEAQLRLESDEALVTIATLHGSKGLEYPIVFMPFGWFARPVDTKGVVACHDGDELVIDLCPEHSESSVDAADRERLAEELRLLYVGLTRAIHRCYVGWSAVKDFGRSAMAHLLHGGDGDLASAKDDAVLVGELAALREQAPESFLVERLALPVSSSAYESGLLGLDAVARPFGGRIERSFRVTSYSGMIRDAGESGERPERDDGPASSESPELSTDPAFRFPRGPGPGTCLHAILEQLEFPDAHGAVLGATVEGALLRHGMDRAQSADAQCLVSQVLDTSLNAAGTLKLRNVTRSCRCDEMEFQFPLGNLHVESLRAVLRRDRRLEPLASALSFEAAKGFMRGYIDLVFQWESRVYLVDYKSNHLGSALAFYDAEGLDAAMREHLYELQYLLYTVALDRYLSGRIPDYDYERHFGGVFYLFLRGMRPEHGPTYGVYHDRPSAALVAALGQVFSGVET